MPASEIAIRSIDTPALYEACEALQEDVWGFAERDIVSIHEQAYLVKNGGIILGAFTDRDDLTGFVLGFAGLTAEGRPKHASHMLGVLPAWRGCGIGARLKWAQREVVLEQGLDLITWTFDPLVAANAHFNFRTLGAICRTYEVEMYGPMRDPMNRGIPSDRFVVEWWIRSPRVVTRLGQRPPPLPPGWTAIPVVGFLGQDASVIDEATLPTKADAVLVPVPRDFHARRQADLSAAVNLRVASRRVFQALFAQGFVVADFIDDRCALFLRRVAPEWLLNEN